MQHSEIILFDVNGKTQLQVTFDRDTAWLSLNQLSELFGRDKSVISRHLSNIFRSGELDKSATVAKNATVQLEGGREVIREVEFYNLDAIISVGYRVNSIQGTKFRQWATEQLKSHLLRGYSINEQRIKDLGKIFNLVDDVRSENQLTQAEASGILSIISDYSKSFLILDHYDRQILEPATESEIFNEISYTDAKEAISKLKENLIRKKEASALFGQEKDETFSGILRNISQTFDGKYLYPSIESQAAHLLYFIIKNHPFSNGNKRIGAFIFIWYLQINGHLLKQNGERKINDNALAAIALLTAQSDPSEKELIIKLIENLVK